MLIFLVGVVDFGYNQVCNLTLSLIYIYIYILNAFIKQSHVKFYFLECIYKTK